MSSVFVDIGLLGLKVSWITGYDTHLARRGEREVTQVTDVLVNSRSPRGHGDCGAERFVGGATAEIGGADATFRQPVVDRTSDRVRRFGFMQMIQEHYSGGVSARRMRAPGDRRREIATCGNRAAT
ncbi:hypothetical protein FZI91_06965 [Mycobacterium sp. CBMA271]|nr:hypothetical protein [Mycobacteroides sp. CBMA 271]